MKKIKLLAWLLSLLLVGCGNDISPPIINSGALQNPLDYKESSGGVPMQQGIILDSEYCYTYIKGISGEFSTAFSSLVTQDEYEQFSQQFAGKNPQGTRNLADFNLITFIRDMNISKQTFVKANSEQRQKAEKNGWSYQGTFTQLEVEVLFSDDSARINKTFVNPNAILFNGEIYTLEWFANNDAEEYRLVGFDVDELREKCDEWLNDGIDVPREPVSMVIANIDILTKKNKDGINFDSDNYAFSAPLIWDYYNIPSKFIELVDDKAEFDEWANKFKAVNFEGFFDEEEYNILSFINRFSITQDRFEMVNDEYTNNGVLLFNDEQVDVLYSGDSALINQYFVNPLALLHRGIIYTPEWFFLNDATAYKAAALPPDVLQNKCIQWEKENTFAEYPSGIDEIRGKIAKLEVIK